MHTPSTAVPRRSFLDPVAILGRSVIAVIGYVGGTTSLAVGAAGFVLWPARRDGESIAAPGFFKVMMQQLFWMIAVGVPIVGMVHIALGSFLSLQAYYGSTFVDGTGAVVGVGLLRNLGGLMTGLLFAGIMAARMIPELRILARRLLAIDEHADDMCEPRRNRGFVLDEAASGTLAIAPCRLAAPRLAAAAIGCLLLSQWGIAVGTFVGWQASQSMMGLSTETFFMMLLKMMWFRDVVGLVVKGLWFGLVPAAICCYEGLGPSALDAATRPEGTIARDLSDGLAPPWSGPVIRAYCLSCAAILLMNVSWFILAYHAVPFYGPTLLPPPVP
jgi:phospholipid/cholesterol/gamma-HCH transport system permease protein